MVTITIGFTPITINFTPMLYVNFVEKGGSVTIARFITPLLGTRRLQIGLWTGASHHVLGDLTNLSHYQPYEGPDDILLGDGSSLEITHLFFLFFYCQGSQSSASHSRRNKDDVYEWPWPNKRNTMGTFAKQAVHKLPFGVSSLQSRGPLDLVYSNSMVEKYFKASLVTLYTDGGTEYKSLKSYFVSQSIQHQVSPPYTPEHVGSAERKHRHVVETGLAMLHKASLPLKYWSHAFLVAAYLINRLPTPVLKHQTPFESLFQQLPNYDKLRAFGCLCFPWLLFIGYSNTHNAYKCLDLSSNRVYISRHVQFIEHQFPLASNTF
ncbi:hypothetical protein AAG906_012563 [Vitis piasezkii]